MTISQRKHLIWPSSRKFEVNYKKIWSKHLISMWACLRCQNCLWHSFIIATILPYLATSTFQGEWLIVWTQYSVSVFVFYLFIFLWSINLETIVRIYNFTRKIFPHRSLNDRSISQNAWNSGGRTNIVHVWPSKSYMYFYLTPSFAIVNLLFFQWITS